MGNLEDIIKAAIARALELNSPHFNAIANVEEVNAILKQEPIAPIVVGIVEGLYQAVETHGFDPDENGAKLLEALMAGSKNGLLTDADKGKLNGKPAKIAIVDGGFDADGFDKNGFDVNGYNAAGDDADGRNRLGYDADGFDAEGYDDEGYTKYGLNSDNQTEAELNGETYVHVKALKKITGYEFLSGQTWKKGEVHQMHVDDATLVLIEKKAVLATEEEVTAATEGTSATTGGGK